MSKSIDMHIENEVNLVKAPWESSPYYNDAEKWTHLFWGENTLFRQKFNRLDLSNVLELACGYGRHSEIVAPMSNQLTLVDVFENNLVKCRKRLGEFDNVTYHLGNGFDFQPIASESISAIFCYDAMVHFSMDIVISYLKDTCRVLKLGGMALYHHSNYEGPAFTHYGQHPHARNIMNFEQLCVCARNSGLSVVDSVVMDWGGASNIDRLTLFANGCV
ncbi:SAM-dependent methyltransferase [Desulfomicrobium macestii]|uniref:SAM-dependent methyltransferase n=1 Tax=Desulfomicrobium macestii TaxID=90731 RepID=A0ABR9H9C1_9BACT|nr:class I SAM-dependent methyltransferase [Desulfomicrobium macestii]MBE1427299.1 SAM-dependent methyltransferase [Desulfomicrobium macestii]